MVSITEREMQKFIWKDVTRFGALRIRTVVDTWTRLSYKNCVDMVFR